MQNRDKSSLAYRLPRLPGARVHPTPTAGGLALLREIDVFRGACPWCEQAPDNRPRCAYCHGTGRAAK
jgi:hypothetical protein